jgi:hypothetical protein
MHAQRAQTYFASDSKLVPGPHAAMAPLYEPTQYMNVYRQCHTLVFQRGYRTSKYVKVTAYTITELRTLLTKRGIKLVLRSPKARDTAQAAKNLANAHGQLVAKKAEPKAKAVKADGDAAALDGQAQAKAKTKANAEGQPVAAKAKSKAKAKAVKCNGAAEAKVANEAPNTEGEPMAKKRRITAKSHGQVGNATRDGVAAAPSQGHDAKKHTRPPRNTWLVVRSHQRPLYAAKTFKILRELYNGAEIRVYVEPSQHEEYARVFDDEVPFMSSRSGAADYVLADGALGCGANVRCAQDDLWAAGGGHLVVVDDNISTLKLNGHRFTTESFHSLLTHAWESMMHIECAGWSAHPCSNPWGRSFADDAPGVHGLRLLYGAFFGMRIDSEHHVSFQTIHGNICDDVERSLRLVVKLKYIKPTITYATKEPTLASTQLTSSRATKQMHQLTTR